MLVRPTNRYTYDVLNQLLVQKAAAVPWPGETRLYLSDGGESLCDFVPFSVKEGVVLGSIAIEGEEDLFVHCEVKNTEVSRAVIQAYLQGISTGISLFYDRNQPNKETDLKNRSQDILFRANRQFHHSNHVHEVLKVITDALTEMMPDTDIELHLANDWGVKGVSGITLMDLCHDQDDLAKNVYVNGLKKYVQDESDGKDLFYSPLPGRQGVYGVMKVSPRFDVPFDPAELSFMEAIAELGGNAIESTHLYEQSRKHIKDLQLISETTNALNESLKVSEILQLLRTKLTAAFGADEALFVMTDAKWQLDFEVDYSKRRQLLLDNPAIQAVIAEIRATKHEKFIADWEITEETAPFGSLVGVPMMHQQDMIGVVLLMGRERSCFSYDQFRLLQSLVQHSSMAFVNAMLHEEMQKVMITDYLTGLNTREYMDTEIRRAMQRDYRGVFLLFDVDHFKQVNDVYGHSIGDDVLIQVAELVKQLSADFESIAVRWGGEELAVYLINARLSDGVELAETIRREVQRLTKPEVTVSCGVSCWSYESQQQPKLKDLFNQADDAMYQAKASGKNTVKQYR